MKRDQLSGMASQPSNRRRNACLVGGMRDSMAAGSRTLAAAATVGALFGVLVVLGIKVYDRALRGTVVDTGD
jgi:hypothetical protein